MTFKSIILSILFLFGILLIPNASYAYDNIYSGYYDDGTPIQVATYDESSFTYHNIENSDVIEGAVAVNEYNANKIVYFQYHPKYNNLWVRVGDDGEWMYIDGVEDTLYYIYAMDISFQLLDSGKLDESKIKKFVPNYREEI